MSSVLNLLCGIAVIFLIACEPVSECSWSKEIIFEHTTKEWLGGLKWPDSAYEDFDKIGDHNELRGKHCQ